MKGLLLKDFYLVRKHCLYFALFIILWPLMMMIGMQPTFMVFSCLITSMLPTSLQAYDEKDKWIKYSDTLPYTRKQIVTVKYIYSLIAIGILITICAVSMTVNTLFIQEAVILSLGEIVLWCSMYLLLCAVISFDLPFIFWLGTEKGRYIYMIMGVLCGMIAVFTTNASFIGNGVSFADMPNPFATSGVLVLIAAAIFASSWGLSVMLYSKREL